MGYAIGWRYNTATNKLEKVSAISISTQPDKATVTVDGRQNERLTPLSLNNLLAGVYTITISKNGYYSWEKEITAYTDQVTRIPLIRLLSVFEHSQQINERTTTAIQYSPKGSYWAVVTDADITIYDSKSKTTLWTYNAIPADGVIQWSPDENYISYRSSVDNSVAGVIVPDQELFSISALVSEPIISYQWSTEEPHILYTHTGIGLYRVNVFQKTATLLSAEPTGQYVGGDLFMTRTDNQLTLHTADLARSAVLNIPAHHMVLSSPPEQGYLLTLDQTAKRLFVTSLESLSTEHFLEQVVGIDWPTDSSKLLYFNTNELWIWDWQTQTKSLVLRTSSKITGARLIADGHYVAYYGPATNLTFIEVAGPQRNSYATTLSGVTAMTYHAQQQQLGVASINGAYLYTTR